MTTEPNPQATSDQQSIDPLTGRAGEDGEHLVKARRVSNAAQASFAPAALHAYRADWQHFCAWCDSGELEFELKNDVPSSLYDAALLLLEIAPPRVEVRSKAERGYDIAAQQRRSPSVVRVQSRIFAADTAVDVVLQDIGRACLADFVRNVPAALAEIPEAAHQMRVAIRHLRSALASVTSRIAGEQYRWANDELRALATSLDAPRNWDVLTEQVLRPVIDSRPGDKMFRRLQALVGHERQSAYQRLKEIIDTPENMVAILRLARWFEASGWRGEPLSAQSAQRTQLIGELAPALIARRYRQAKKRIQGFKSLSPSERHRLRIALKKLRYTIEFLACLFDTDEVDSYLKTLRSLQDDLGYVNDIRTARIILGRLSDATDDSAVRQAIKLVLEWHMHNLTRQKGRLRKHVHRFRQAKPFW